MKQVTLYANNLNGEKYLVNYNKVYTRVDDSYKAKTKDVLRFVFKIRTLIFLYSGIIYKRNASSWAVEWVAHSRLYKLGLFKIHTKDVDFDEDESLFRRICYHIIALDYVIFLGLL